MNDWRKRSIQEAEDYIRLHQSDVKERYRPAFHASAPVGWINDPNGLCWFRGMYHMFGQYHPYSAKWGPMHWGHWVSSDLLHWEWKGVAMAPDQDYDHAGVFSGTALVEGDTLVLMYTGVSEMQDGKLCQQQCIARSTDGIHFVKDPANPVIRISDLPPDVPPRDFRDPKLFRTADGYRAIMAARNEQGGEILVYSSPDLAEWKLEGRYAEGIGRMLECPDYHRIDGEDVLIFCVIGLPEEPGRFPCGHTAAYMTGKTKENPVGFQAESFEAVDLGLNFYAPQALDGPDGCILTAWLPGPSGIVPTDELGHQWAGVMALPRILHVKDGKLIQEPVGEIRKLRAKKQCFHEVLTEGVPLKGKHERCSEWVMHLKADREVVLKFFKGEGPGFCVTWDPEADTLTMDRDGCGYDMSGKLPSKVTANLGRKSGEITLDLIVDNCIAELFVNGGERVMSASVYPKDADDEWVLTSSGSCEAEVTCYDLSPQEKDV